jgi:hypothetical protein
MKIDFAKKDRTELLGLEATYQKIIEDEPNTTMAELSRQRIVQIRLALAKKGKSLLEAEEETCITKRVNTVGAIRPRGSLQL